MISTDQLQLAILAVTVKKFPEILIHEYYLKKGIQLEILQIKLGGL